MSWLKVFVLLDSGKSPPTIPCSTLHIAITFILCLSNNLKYYKHIAGLLKLLHWPTSLQVCCSVAKSCPALSEPVDCSTPGSPVLHYLLEFAQIRVCWHVFRYAAKSLQSCPTLCDPHRRQPTRLPHPWDSPGKNTGAGCHFLLQCMKMRVKVKSLSHVWLVATPWTAAYQAPPSMGFSRQEYWSGVPLSSGIQDLYFFL